MTRQRRKATPHPEPAHSDSRQGAGSRLHLLLSPAPDVVAQCRAQLAAGDTVVLLDRGVECAVEHALSLAEFEDVKCRVAGIDLRARGLAVQQGFQEITDSQLVEAVLAHRHTLSWS